MSKFAIPSRLAQCFLALAPAAALLAALFAALLTLPALSFAAPRAGPDLSASTNTIGQLVAAHSLLTYTIVLRNTGDPAPSVVLTETVPDGTIFSSCTTTRGPCLDWTGRVWSGPLDSYDSVRVTYVVSVTDLPPYESIENTAYIDDSNAVISRTAVMQVDAGPDLSMSFKVPSALTVTAQTLLTYTLVMRNTGDAAPVAVLTDQPPGGTQFVSCTTTRGPCLGSSGRIWAGSIESDDQVRVTYVVTVTGGPPWRPIANTASFDDSYRVISRTAVSALVGGPNLSASTKTASPVVAPNSLLTYTIVLRNIGDPAPSVVLTDTVPDGTLFVSCTTTRGPCLGSSGRIWAGPIDRFDYVRVTYVVRIMGGTLGFPIVNTAYIDDSIQVIGRAVVTLLNPRRLWLPWVLTIP